LTTLFIVSDLELIKVSEAGADLEEIAGLGKIDIIVKKSRGKKCMRCWNYTSDVGEDKNNKDICMRCAKVLEKIS
jgi:isoleucyl-tRNA synthetase